MGEFEINVKMNCGRQLGGFKLHTARSLCQIVWEIHFLAVRWSSPEPFMLVGNDNDITSQFKESLHTFSITTFSPGCLALAQTRTRGASSHLTQRLPCFCPDSWLKSWTWRWMIDLWRVQVLSTGQLAASSAASCGGEIIIAASRPEATVFDIDMTLTGDHLG